MRAPSFWTRPGPIPSLLRPLGHLWAAAGAWRHARTQPWRAPVPVICVGNLVLGGAGKTPVVISLARLLRKEGFRPHIVSRGYGGRLGGPVAVDPGRHGAAEVGDEPLLLVKAAPTWVARDRRAGILAAVAGGADSVLLDDGFQNPAVAKDLSLVVIDRAYGFGNGEVFPAGPLRERPETGLARAGAVILLGEYGEVALPPPCPPLLRARLVVTDAPPLAGRRVLAFAGIGRPAKFYATLAEQGAVLAGRRDFPDHHPYRRAEIERIVGAAERSGALPVTTEKDWVRLPAALRDRIARISIAVEWMDEAAVKQLLPARSEKA